MRHLALSLALIALSGCPKKDPGHGGTADVGAQPTGTFVDLGDGEDEEDLDDLFGSELMQATAQCGDLVKLEPSAMMGRLKDGEIRCLDKTLKELDRQTYMDKVSRVLMADAWAKGNMERWEVIVRRHLNEIDQSDPDLCYKFAKHLVSQDSLESSDEAIKWADVALENRSRWEGDVHVRRVYTLYKIKALAAQSRWLVYESKYLAAPSEELMSARQSARDDMKTMSREWLEYARSAGADDTLAYQLCVSAAGTDEYCR
ncbi:MAG: hypothetical protein JXX28_09800 [Deltaproteobacteria bacterium]|nr:hypothetical protein [Deltaproteobacteria bacterium]